MDILNTNPYSDESLGNTYGVQRAITDYKDKQRREREFQNSKIVLENESMPDVELDMNDPLYTNRIDTSPEPEQYKKDLVLRPGPDLRSGVAMESVGITRDPQGPIGLRPIIDPITGAKSAGRQIYEKIRLISISSRDRQKTICKEVPVDPVTCQYTRLHLDDNGKKIVCRYTSDLLNAEYYWNAQDCINNITNICHTAGCNPICQIANENLHSLADPFFTKDCRIFMKIPLFPNPNNYTIHFDSPFSYIREISLIASEIPNPYQTIGPHNNRIIFHIKEAKSGKILPFRPDYRGIPFYLIEIVPGIYSLENLLCTMESLANLAIEEKTNRQDLKFQIRFDKVTQVIKITLTNHSKRGDNRIQWIFHWRFWSHWSIPEERTLYRMLGFARPFLLNRDGSDYYSSCYDNAWNLCHNNRSDYGESGICTGNDYPRPFAKPNLFPQTFFYLIIDNINLGNDAIYTCNPNITINNIFAKIQIIPCDRQGSSSSCCNTEFIGDHRYLYNTAVSSNKVYLDSPLRTLDKMDIRFVDEFGELIDFNNLDHSLTFRIIQYIDYLVDSNFDSTRGI